MLASLASSELSSCTADQGIGEWISMKSLTGKDGELMWHERAKWSVQH